MKLRSTRLGVPALGLFMLALTACGAPAGNGAAAQSTEGSSAPEAEGPVARVATGAVDVERSRAQAIVDARYAPSDVKHSFRTKNGQTIDCIDFFAQPGVKELARRGTPVTELPPPARRYVPSGKHTLLDQVAFDGSLDESGHARACSDTTVPIVRVTADDILAAGGVDAYLHAHTSKAPPPHLGAHAAGFATDETGAPVAPPDGAGASYAHVYTQWQGTGTYYATVASLSVLTPTLSTSTNSNDHSLMQTWTTSPGNLWTPSGCGSNCVQTVEVGWTIDRGLNGGSTTPHLFIYSTGNGYQTGCYNNSVESNLSGAASGCPSWVGAPGSSFTPGMNLASDSGSSLTITTTATGYGGQTGWGIYLGTGLDGSGAGADADLGYYPASNYSGTFKTAGSVFQAGGEVDDLTDLSGNTDSFTLPMATNGLAISGYGSAAWVAEYAVFTNGGESLSFSAPIVTESQYAASTSPAGPPGYLNDYFYLGAPFTIHICTWCRVHL